MPVIPINQLPSGIVPENIRQAILSPAFANAFAEPGTPVYDSDANEVYFVSNVTGGVLSNAAITALNRELQGLPAFRVNTGDRALDAVLHRVLPETAPRPETAAPAAAPTPTAQPRLPVTASVRVAARRALQAEGIREPTQRQIETRAQQILQSRQTTTPGGLPPQISPPGGITTPTGVEDAVTPTTTTAGGVAGGAVAGGVAATAPGTAGETVFNTGNPDLDNFLNNTYLPLLEAEFSGDPTKVLDPQVFQQISQRIENTFGPILKNELAQIETTFNRRQQELTLQRERGLRGIEVPGAREVEDIDIRRQREEEDKLRTLADNARNFEELQLRTRENFRQRGLTFSGLRQEEEQRLREEEQRKVADIEREAGRQLSDLERARRRTLEDVTAERGFLERRLGPTGLEAQELQSQLEKERQQLAGERVMLEAEERRRLRDLGASLIQNPQFIPS